MALGPQEIVLWAAMLGILVGIVWSLKYIVVLDRRIEKIEGHMETLLEHMQKPKRK